MSTSERSIILGSKSCVVLRQSHQQDRSAFFRLFSHSYIDCVSHRNGERRGSTGTLCGYAPHIVARKARMTMPSLGLRNSRQTVSYFLRPMIAYAIGQSPPFGCTVH